MTVDVPGVDLAAITFNAGPVNSPGLLRVGSTHAGAGKASEQAD